MTWADSYCRLCLNGCAIKVRMEVGKAVEIAGAPENPVYRGFVCVKGRSQLRLLEHPDRVLRPLKRRADGGFDEIGLEQAISEIAGRLTDILATSPPRAVAGYLGTALSNSAAMAPLFTAFMDAIGTPMRFSPGSIDKPGKQIAAAFHGRWMAPAVGFDDPEAILLSGINPLVTFTGFPYGNPGRWLNDRLAAGAKLIVIDPRRSDVAKRAHIHLAIRPGTDAAVLAAMLRVMLAEGLYDRDFAKAHVDGVEQLRAAVDRFTPQAAARLADIDADQLVEAARIIGATRRGYVMAGTGPNMSGAGTLIEYLMQDIQTLAGHWLRAGETVRHPGVLAAALETKAQVAPPIPAYGFGEPMHARGVANTAAGMPIPALPDEMLLEGPNRVRALISCGGNPAGAWPDQEQVIRGLNNLDLLVQIDPWMSATAKLADYVIPPAMWIEVTGTSQFLDWLTRAPTGYGQLEPYGQYSPALVDPPAGSEVIEEWAFFYELARRMGLPLKVSAQFGPSMPTVDLDMAARPTTEALMEQLCQGGRVTLAEVKRHPGGAIFRGEPVLVQPADADANERFEAAHPVMMAELAKVALEAAKTSEAYPLRLLCRRMMHAYNTMFVDALPASQRPYNPAFMHPDDMADLSLAEGDLIEIASARTAIGGVVHADAGLRRGIVSMAFGFGGLAPSLDEGEVRRAGSNTTSLVDADGAADPYSGQPQMSNIPVRVSRAQTSVVSTPAS